MKKTIALALIGLSFSICTGWAQDGADLIAKNLELARQLIDRGRYDESIELLDDADAFDTNRTALWSYEKGLANYLKRDLRAAVGSLKKAARFRDASEEVFRLLAECYKATDRPEMALMTCDRGLSKFPDSGRLFHEAGLVWAGEDDPGMALGCFTEGIVREPDYPDNWFDAAEIQLASEDRAFGMVNGETAICLEPGSQRSEKMAAALAATYRQNITFPGDTTAVTGFSTNLIFGGEIPFPLVYEVILSHAAAGARDTDITSLIAIRRLFVEYWFGLDMHTLYPCALLDYHRALIEAGHFEAYNYWLFASAPPDETDFDAFEEWFDRNRIFEP